MRGLQDIAYSRCRLLSDFVRFVQGRTAFGARRVSARRSAQSATRSGLAVPAEISGKGVSAMWSNVDEVREWYVDHGLVWPEGRATHDEAPGRRRDRAARAWALANGLASAGLPKFLDHRGCRLAGVAFAGSRRFR